MYFSFFFHQLCPPHHGWMAQLWCLSRCRRMGSPPTPGPASHSQFLVLPPRAPQPQGSCSSPQGPSGGQAKSLQSPPRAHLLLFPRCRGHWPKDTQLTTSGARFTPRVRGPRAGRRRRGPYLRQPAEGGGKPSDGAQLRPALSSRSPAKRRPGI